MLATIPAELPGFRIIKALTGANSSSQCNATFGYDSLIDGHVEPVSIEIGVREPTLLDTYAGMAKTALIHPVRQRAWIDPYPVESLAWREAMAEKVRAALCRREVAIRDFFDVDHAVHRMGLDTLEPAFVELLVRKLSVPGTEPPDVSAARVEELHRQRDAELTPVLRETDRARFDLDRAVATVRDIANALGRR